MHDSVDTLKTNELYTLHGWIVWYVTCISIKLFLKINLLYLIFFLIFIYLFIYLWLCWVFVSVRGPSLVVASGGHSSSRCAGLSLSRLLLLRGTGSRRAGSVVVAHWPSCSAACGIFPDQGSNPCPLHWQADSQPLHHQGSPYFTLLRLSFHICKNDNTWERKEDWLSFISFCLFYQNHFWDPILSCQNSHLGTPRNHLDPQMSKQIPHWLCSSGNTLLPIYWRRTYKKERKTKKNKGRQKRRKRTRKGMARNGMFPPKFICWKLTPNVMVFGGGDFGRW